MVFNSHTKVGGVNSAPNSLIKPVFGLKTGGNQFEKIKSTLGDVVKTFGENTKDVGTTLQGHFNRFLNNPMFATNKNTNDNKLSPSLDLETTPEPEIKNKISSINSLPTTTEQLPTTTEQPVTQNYTGGKLIKNNKKTRKHKKRDRKQYKKYIKTKKAHHMGGKKARASKH